MTHYYTEYNVSVTADTKILDTNYTPKYGIEDISIINIYVTPEDTGVLSVVRIKDSVEYDEKLNSGTALLADCAYLFSLLISEDEINLKYSATTTFKYLQIREEL